MYSLMNKKFTPIFIAIMSFLLIGLLQKQVFAQVIDLEEWVARYNGLANLEDIPIGIVVDSAGNVYVAGNECTFLNSLGFCGFNAQVFTTIKYDSTGAQQWINSGLIGVLWDH